MSDVDIFLNAIKAANGDNPILNTLTTDGVAFIDYKNLGDRIIDGIKVNSCIRLKTLPSSGFVGSRKIFYSRISLSSLYPFVDQVMVLVSDHADVRELLKELGEQAGIVINPEILVNDLDEKLVFDNKMCGSITLKTNPRSIYIEGELKVKYTCNKYRVLNYVKNRVIIISEDAVIDSNITSQFNLVLPSFYYCDAANFPPDHEVFVKYNCLAGANGLNDQIVRVWHNGKTREIPYKSPIFESGNMVTYFKNMMRKINGNMEFGQEMWNDYVKYNFRQVVHAFLKWYSQDTKLGLFTENLPDDGGVAITGRISINTLDGLDFYYIGKTTELVTTIKNDPMYKITQGNCGVNVNFGYVCAFKLNSKHRNIPRRNSIIPIYWG